MKKLLAIAAFSFVTTFLQADYIPDYDKHRIRDSQIQVEAYISLPDGRRVDISQIRRDEDGFYILDEDVVDVYLVEKKRSSSGGSAGSGYVASDCYACGDRFDSNWDRHRHIDDFQCSAGKQGCARR
jgi:hypothetical protein